MYCLQLCLTHVIVDDERHLLHIDTAGKQIGGDQHARRAGAELLHDQLTLLAGHVTVHGGHGEIALALCVDEQQRQHKQATVSDRHDNRVCHICMRKAAFPRTILSVSQSTLRRVLQ
jgi:hypothetical protein